MDAIYSTGDFVTKQTIDNLRLLEGEPAGCGDCPKLRLRLQVRGRLEVGKQSLPACGLIEQIAGSSRYPVT